MARFECALGIDSSRGLDALARIGRRCSARSIGSTGSNTGRHAGVVATVQQGVACAGGHDGCCDGNDG